MYVVRIAGGRGRVLTSRQIKYLRVEDGILEVVKEQQARDQAQRQAGRGGLQGRGEHGGRGERGRGGGRGGRGRGRGGRGG